jgi:hypothetical protein
VYRGPRRPSVHLLSYLIADATTRWSEEGTNRGPRGDYTRSRDKITYCVVFTDECAAFRPRPWLHLHRALSWPRCWRCVYDPDGASRATEHTYGMPVRPSGCSKYYIACTFVTLALWCLCTAAQPQTYGQLRVEASSSTITRV